MSPKAANKTPISEAMGVVIHCARPEQQVKDLVGLFLEEGIGAAPVMDEDGKAVGLVSKTDVVRSLRKIESNNESTGHEVQPWWDSERLAQLTVEQIMTPCLYSFSPETTIADATAAMAFEGIHHLPVVDGAGTLVGVISTLDILNWNARNEGYRPAEGKDGRAFIPPA
jgi:CBS-domain-containing membrane protein